ncbi:unnamed protein product [Protopolystoma xenopodis]|uniref:Uncharacterized protein n=1 Tax=Protopolystoma xenopodis TaxID=117903 RepID=A0A448WM44_9PLAT|nr:unnamed protein product [Protopolystoma xenopodis]
MTSATSSSSVAACISNPACISTSILPALSTTQPHPIPMGTSLTVVSGFTGSPGGPAGLLTASNIPSLNASNSINHLNSLIPTSTPLSSCTDPSTPLYYDSHTNPTGPQFYHSTVSFHSIPSGNQHYISSAAPLTPHPASNSPSFVTLTPPLPISQPHPSQTPPVSVVSPHTVTPPQPPLHGCSHLACSPMQSGVFVSPNQHSYSISMTCPLPSLLGSSAHSIPLVPSPTEAVAAAPSSPLSNTSSILPTSGMVITASQATSIDITGIKDNSDKVACSTPPNSTNPPSSSLSSSHSGSNEASISDSLRPHMSCPSPCLFVENIQGISDREPSRMVAFSPDSSERRMISKTLESTPRSPSLGTCCRCDQPSTREDPFLICKDCNIRGNFDL